MRSVHFVYAASQDICALRRNCMGAALYHMYDFPTAQWALPLIPLPFMGAYCLAWRVLPRLGSRREL
jgi:hypothetical protein